MGLVAFLSVPLAFASNDPVLGALVGGFLLAVCGLSLLRVSTRRSRYPIVGRLMRPAFPPRTFLGSIPIATLLLAVLCPLLMTLLSLLMYAMTSPGRIEESLAWLGLILAGFLAVWGLVRLVW